MSTEYFYAGGLAWSTKGAADLVAASTQVRPSRPVSDQPLNIVARSEPPRCPKGTHSYVAENAGRCLTRYTCRTCGKVKIIDSGD